jgi:hypothetical protein
MVAFLALVLRFVHVKENKKLEKLDERAPADADQAEIREGGDRRTAGFRYVY